MPVLRSLVRAFPAVALLAAAFPSARAAEPLCVTCSGPERVYACSVEGDASAASDIAIQLLCIQELAREGRHQSCAVRKSAGACPGEPRTLAYVAPDLGAPVPTEFPVEETATVSPPAASAEPAPEAPAGEPETLVDLAGEAAAGTGRQLRKAGEAVESAASKTGTTIKNAAKSTWSCLSSLFSDCGGEEETAGDSAAQ
jgi:hypothetical protein